MKTPTFDDLIISGLLLTYTQSVLRTKSYSIDWCKVAGGGGASRNGRQDASGSMTGGSYSLTGGL
jgi:hypothetical protein